MTGRSASMVASSPPDSSQAHGLTIIDAAFALVVIVLAYFRFRILQAGGAPPTIDGANWLALGDEIFGHGVRSPTIVYPPLVPILAKTSVAVFGLAPGISGLAAVASTAPAIGTYVALRGLGAGLVALPPSILLLGASSVGEATAWGGFPQLIGLGLLPIALVQLDRMLRTWSPRDALGAGLAFAGVLATSHLIAAVALIAGLALTIATIGRRRPRNSLKATITSLALFAVPSLWLIPVYISLLGAFTGTARAVPFFSQTEWSTVLDQVEFLYRDSPWLWRTLFGLAVVALPVFARHRSTTLWRVSASTISAIVVAVAVTRESRFLYVLTPFTALGLALWSTHASEVARRYLGRSRPDQRARRVATGFLVLLLAGGAWQIAVGLEFFESQRATYGVLTPDLVRGFEIVAESTTANDTLAITSLNDAPIGWWVEAIAKRETVYGAPIRWLLFEDEIRRATIANELFIPPFPDAERIRKASNAGIDLVLVPTRWVFYDEEAMSDFAASYPGSVEYVTDELVVIDPAAVP